MYSPTTAPVLYLNSLEHEGKQFIRIWHKPDQRIIKRLKESTFIKYSKTYKCFVTHKTPQVIEQLHQYFLGIALVDTRYLNRPKRLRPALGVIMTGSNQHAEPLEKLPALPVVRLQPLLYNKSMFKIYTLRCKLVIKEPDFTFSSPHSAAMKLKKHFVRTFSDQFSHAKTKFKHALIQN